ncbi:putative Rho GTPase activator [Talaromyces proteolyticus]|uniref:Rho GTPase activator n=1 Tax=Talaromyces proteolyticus TaxID=1131652 RepID=A0AAD4Q565_9EURO|nr:putative Rho GTPase activator [Talaromyces proteolyticus]KAH8703849.1 putative Rho GTPase activator [Talaromyces proteolyticus]
MAEASSPSTSLSALRPSQDDGASTPHTDAPQPLSDVGASDPAPVDTQTKERLEKILQSEIGVTTLLNRLKQSIAAARDYALFLKKRSGLEEEHAHGLKKIARSAQEAAHRLDSRQGSYGHAQDEISRIHEQMADHGLQFAVSLYQMSTDLNELAENIEKSRKQWKASGLAAEKKVQDAEGLVEKAKAKYDTLAEQYDRVKTGDKQGGKFGLKGHKSAVQQEEELNRKVQAADADYKAKVQAAQSARQELVTTHRPQTVHQMRQLIFECDSGLTLQLQKYASFNEKHLLGKGLSVSPLKNETGGGPKSLREVVHDIDSEGDFNRHILGFEGNSGSVAAPQVQYVRHHTLGSGPTTSAPGPAPTSAPSSQPNSTNARQPSPLSAPSQPSVPPSSAPGGQGPQTQLPSLSSQQSPDSFHSAAQYQAFPSSTSSRPQQPPSGPPYPTGPVYKPTQSTAPMMHPPNGYQNNLPPVNPVFGISLEDLFRRDGTAVPVIVYQCIQAVEMFGLDMEGIYRQSGSANHINHMKSLFDNDSSKVDFTNPESFFHDVNSVAGLLKQFFRELPDPLFTRQNYADFINAARVDNQDQRRDTLHAIINGLPDPNYATLRALVLHLNRVQEHASSNRMSAGNIAICFGPTLMGASGANLVDSGWQNRVIETVLLNTFQIFDDD